MPDDGSGADTAERFLRDAAPAIGRLTARARQLTRDPHDADELVQDTMLLAYRGFHTYQPESNLNAWLLQIMQNRWISLCRRRSRRPRLAFVGDMGDDFASVRMPTDAAAESVALDMIVDPRLHAALMNLHHDVRATLFYAYFVDLPHKDIARVLDVPVGTVMSRLHRGRGLLRQSLAEHPIAELGDESPNRRIA